MKMKMQGRGRKKKKENENAPQQYLWDAPKEAMLREIYSFKCLYLNRRS